MSGNSFPTAWEKWDDLPTMAKTWSKWKEHFLDAQSHYNMQRRPAEAPSEAQMPRPPHGITPVPVPHPYNASALTPSNDSAITAKTVNSLNGYLNNLSAAATNKM